jgi:hypothetical protein
LKEVAGQQKSMEKLRQQEKRSKQTVLNPVPVSLGGKGAAKDVFTR